MKTEKIKPIPKYIIERIRRLDKKVHCGTPGMIRFYSYLTKNDKELVKVTVAVKCYRKKWYCKQVAVHGLHSDKCFIKDIIFYYMGNYNVGWFAEGLQKRKKWYESPDWDWHYDKYFDPYAPLVNKEFIARFPEFKYSAYTLYKGVHILKYLRLYEQYPQLEYLMKLGLQNYAFSVTILKRIGQDKAFCKWMIRNKNALNKPWGGYYSQTILEAYKTNQPLSEIQTFLYRKKCFEREHNFALIRKIFPGRKLRNFFSYIDQQKIEPHLYLDYLTACNHLGLDMSLSKNLFPHDFMRWHDIRIDQYATAKAEADIQVKKELCAKFALIAEKYLPLQHDKRSAFICIIAKSPDDLIREGETLQHCVGRMNYDLRFIREESLIFFIRNRKQPDVPFVTVEYSLKTHTVLQCYGEYDHKPDEEVLHYVRKVWLPYANKQLKQIAV